MLPCEIPNYIFPIIKPVGSKCNLSCYYCYYRERKLGNELMSHHVLEKMIKELLDYNLDYAPFLWHGGEPTLAGLKFYEEVINLQEKYKRPTQRINNMIQTNGTTLDEEWMRFFNEAKFSVGISLDGPKELHETYRPKSYNKLINNIKIMKKLKIQFGAICVVNSNNVKYPLEVYSFLKKVLSNTVSIKPCIEMDEKGEKLSEYSTDPIEYTNFMIQIFDKWYEDDDPTFIIREFENIILGLLGTEPILCTNRACGCQRYITINYDGLVYACDSFVGKDYHEYAYGYLIENNFTELLTSKNALYLLKLQYNNFKKCESCIWEKICGGGCSNFKLHLSEYYWERYCESRKIMFNHIQKHIN